MVRAAPCEIRTILLTRVSIVATPKSRDCAHQTNRKSGAGLISSDLRVALLTRNQNFAVSPARMVRPGAGTRVNDNASR